jgi:hypothetical protein
LPANHRSMIVSAAAANSSHYSQRGCTGRREALSSTLRRPSSATVSDWCSVFMSMVGKSMCACVSADHCKSMCPCCSSKVLCLLCCRSSSIWQREGSRQPGRHGDLQHFTNLLLLSCCFLLPQLPSLAARRIPST